MSKTKKKDNVSKKLGELDVVFIIDATASMTPYINEAKQRTADTLKSLQEDGDLDIRVALIAYRDHPPQEYSFVTQVTDLGSIENFQSQLLQLTAQGGGDLPEAVWDGVDALFTLNWREGSDRVAYLIGDAPPHDPYPTQLTAEDLVEKLFDHQIQVNAHSIANSKDTTKAFSLLVEATGGEITVGQQAEAGTVLYDSTLRGKSMDINVARKLAHAADSMGYTTAMSEMPADVYVAASNAAGLSATDAARAMEYLKKRDL